MDLTSFIAAASGAISPLLAQASGGGGGDAGGGSTPMIAFMAAMGVIIYIMLLRPKQQEDKKRAEMIDSLVRGDHVITNGGIHGTVEGVDASKKTITLVIGPKNTMTVEKWAVHSVTPKKKAGQDKDEKKAEEAGA